MDAVLSNQIKSFIYKKTYANYEDYTKYIDPINHWINILSQSKFKLEVRLKGRNLPFNINNLSQLIYGLIFSDSKNRFHKVSDVSYEDNTINIVLSSISSEIYFDHIPINLIAMVLSYVDHLESINNYCAVKYKYCDRSIWLYILMEKYKVYINDILYYYKKMSPGINYEALFKDLQKIDLDKEMSNDYFIYIPAIGLVTKIISIMKLRKWFPHLYNLAKDDSKFIDIIITSYLHRSGDYYQYFKTGTLPVEYNFSIEYGDGIIYHIINNPVIMYDLVHTPNFKIFKGDSFSLYIILRTLLQNSHLFELYVRKLASNDASVGLGSDQNTKTVLLSFLEDYPSRRIPQNEYNKIRDAIISLKIIQKFR